MAIKPKTMTTQEYVKKEADNLTEIAIPGTMESETGMIAKQEYKNGAYHGLSVGIELAKDFQPWVDRGYIKVRDKYMLKYGRIEDIESYKTTSELFEIFLTERNEK